MMAGGDNREIRRKVPLRGQYPARFTVIHAERLLFTFQEVPRIMVRIAEHSSVLLRMSEQQSQPADVMQQPRGVGSVLECGTGASQFFRDHGAGYHMPPAE